MSICQKIISGVDAVLDCIPIISTLTNGAQILYKQAYKVDAVVHPVDAGFKGALKLHVLSKDLSKCKIGLIPIFGNLKRFQTLVFPTKAQKNNDSSERRAFLFSAVKNNDRNLIRLVLQNRPKEANTLSEMASWASPDLETFQELIQHPSITDLSLIQALKNTSTHQQTSIILDLCKNRRIRWDTQESPIEAHKLVLLLLQNNTDLVDRLIDFLPEDAYQFKDIEQLLSSYSVRYEPASISCSADILSERSRERLIRKSKKPSPEDLYAFFDRIEPPRTFFDERQRFFVIHYLVFQQLLSQLDSAALEEITPDATDKTKNHIEYFNQPVENLGEYREQALFNKELSYIEIDLNLAHRLFSILPNETKNELLLGGKEKEYCRVQASILKALLAKLSPEERSAFFAEIPPSQNSNQLTILDSLLTEEQDSLSPAQKIHILENAVACKPPGALDFLKYWMEKWRSSISESGRELASFFANRPYAPSESF